ncbi:MAG: hypothetical protein HOW73_49335 [Polyangiaceae bacterium]|nr:hypothetical protein [Polyangiaceae bacterium]
MQVGANRLGGATINYPDPCIATWVNFAFMTDAVGFSPNTYWTGGNAVTMAATLTISHGDEPDTPLYAPTIGPCIFPMGIAKVLINGNPALAVGCPSISNAGNATSGAVTIPSPCLVFLMFRPEGTQAAELTAEFVDAVTRLSDSTTGAARGQLLEGGVGYYRIDAFAGATPSLAYGAIRDLCDRGMERLVLDLRDNPGGELHAALELAGDFLEPGTHLATLVDECGDSTEFHARPGEPWRMPVAVLVNEQTASAAELFAASLQLHGRARVRGARSYGKGAVQTIAADPSGGALARCTVGHVILPDGRSIQGSGVVPDSLR